MTAARIRAWPPHTDGERGIPHSDTRRGYLVRIVRQRSTFGDSLPWSDPSQTFTDTQRVDLFNDPRWETAPREVARGAVAIDPQRPVRWTMGSITAVWHALTGRGKHSRDDGEAPGPQLRNRRGRPPRRAAIRVTVQLVGGCPVVENRRMAF